MKWKSILLVVISILLVIGTNYLLIDKGVTKPLGEVIYPKAYAFDDYDTRGKLREENPVKDSSLEAINNFAYKTGSLILKEAEENINYSPLSLYYALALATSGARSNTEKELLDLLGMPNGKILSEEAGNLYRLLYRDNKIGKLKIANSIWMDDDMEGQEIVFKDSFIENAVNNFYASVYKVDFSDKETGDAMGKWIADNTNGTLAPEIETSPDQILSIINTVYFYDQWVNRFNKEKTQEDIFYLLNKEQVRVDFMNQTFGSAGYSIGDNYTRAALSLKNGGRMVFILPDEGTSPYDLVSSAEKIKEVFRGGEGFNGEVVWKLPKFNFQSQFKLIENLKTLGVREAFEAHADFTGITDHMAFIGNIEQGTYISIDEVGVEASAFTQIDYAGSALPEGRAEMILDRPFVYAIVTSNENILFMGICLNPAE